MLQSSPISSCPCRNNKEMLPSIKCWANAMRGNWVASNILPKSLVQSCNMQGIHGENLIVVRKGTIGNLKLYKDIKLIWLIDYSSAYKSKELQSWMKTNHLTILVIFVLSNCTIVYQPHYAILHKPFKHGFKQAFDFYTSNVLMKQIQHSTRNDVKIDTKLKALNLIYVVG